jgi:uncharacterized protein with GYD domain
MPTYIALLTWTDQGIRNVRDTVERAQRAEEAAQKLGARLKQIYWTVDQYDLVGIIEAPDDETARAFVLGSSTEGSVRITQLRAFDREEMRGIIERIGPPATA